MTPTDETAEPPEDVAAEAPEPVALRECDKIDDPEEIDRVVMGLVNGQIFTAAQIPEHENLGMVFMPLALGGLQGIDPETIGNVYEWIDKAGPRSCNGLPMFMSCKIVHQDDWAIIAEKATKVYEAQQAALHDE